MRQQRNEWHSVYTHPNLWEFYRPSAVNHASYFFDWTTQVELNWKENYRALDGLRERVQEPRPARVVVGSDSGYTFNLYGFGFVQEMELFQEAGFHPLEVIQAATLKGAELLGLDDRLGSIEEEKIADFVILEENPLHNLKVPLRHRHHPAQPRDRPDRAHRLHQVPDEGRHPLRHPEAALRRPRDRPRRPRRAGPPAPHRCPLFLEDDPRPRVPETHEALGRQERRPVAA